ncbi:hypothetical protein ZMO01_14970 [Zymomonas mobilis subsp. mobilis]|nr:hypothetical protein ZMO01_14970 [Zymomonas mobilis subsp. mobilis]
MQLRIETGFTKNRNGKLEIHLSLSKKGYSDWENNPASIHMFDADTQIIPSGDKC